MSKNINELVEELIEGDESVFSEIVSRYQKKIYTLAFHILGNHLDADEVVQETFVRIYNRRKDLKHVKYFTSFILRIATNYSIDLVRKRKHQSGNIDDETTLTNKTQLFLSRNVTTPLDDLANKKIMIMVKKALELLPPKQRMTAILHDIEGYSKSEIADIFDCPEATVRSNLHIARTKLKKILKQQLDGSKNDMPKRYTTP